ncbi:type I-E CRISPR-associated protein Cse2/CasB [Pseudomonas sp. NW5]|uniref:type I-E CRISPR-associated protein Cse2/CasB n=1 Tax=Pseudomonas sp. NW5 TaxID=2934934 RepID=UPI00202280DB|nr:type I-E CRISPR-associated protein Cse2/CasB [Pseudomonas sp. NW5]MCL7462698.1 type I-E CRISPR-associated protein Cse2/CasB [Pseudomonas sp. NW5]
MSSTETGYSQAFINHLREAFERDSAARATLRRSLAFEPGCWPPAYPWVERFVPADCSASSSQRRALYAVAALYARHPKQGSTTLATALGQLMRERGSASIEKRFVALLAADAENLMDYLRQIISLLAADEKTIDYAALLDDLRVLLNPYADPDWRDRIRQQWARAFYLALNPLAQNPSPAA